MSDVRLPFWKHYPRDWLSDQRHALLSLEQEGALRRLMDHYWTDGGLPADPTKLARLLRVAPERFEDDIWPEIEGFFVENGDGLLEHEELAFERDELLERKRKLSEAGRRGAAKTNRKRWGIGDPDGEGDAPPDRIGDPDGPPDVHPDGQAAATPTDSVGDPDETPSARALAREGRRQTADGRGGSTGGEGAPETEGAKSHQEETDEAEEDDAEEERAAAAADESPPFPF